MTIDVKINNKQAKVIAKKLKKFNSEITNRQIMNAILLKVKNSILLRTNSGKDVDNRPFQTYNRGYAKKEGKTLVNLTKSGTMLNAMTQKALSNSKGKIFFLNSGYLNSNTSVRDLVKYHNTGSGVPKREFFGVNQVDDKLALKTYQKGIKKAKQKAGL